MLKTEKELFELLNTHKNEIGELWKNQLIVKSKAFVETVGFEEVKTKIEYLLDNFIKALLSGAGEDIETEGFDEIKKLLKEMSSDLTAKNFSPSEICIFIFSLKDAIFPVVQKHISASVKIVEYILFMNSIIDKLGLFSFEIYLDTRENIIREQQKAFMDVSVPVVKVWNKIIMIPLIGMLDSQRTQLMMERMLSVLEDTQSKVAILDISGIPIVDTLVARHLITAASAVRLMGSKCIITGIRSQISQTLVQIGVDLSGLVTCSSLSDGLQLALELTNQKAN